MKGQPGPYKDHSHPRTSPTSAPVTQACLRALAHALLPGMSSTDTHSQPHVSPFTTCQSLHQCHLSRRPSLTSLFNKPTHPTLLLPVYRHLKPACELSIHWFSVCLPPAPQHVNSMWAGIFCMFCSLLYPWCPTTAPDTYWMLEKYLLKKGNEINHLTAVKNLTSISFSLYQIESLFFPKRGDF